METNGKLWEINGISLPLDLSDADVMARYEDAFEAMKQDETDIPRDGRASERIRGYCRMYRNLYDRLFGEGTAARIFDGLPTSSEVYESVYASFLDFVTAQAEEVARRRAEVFNKYFPSREQKRAAGHGKHKA